MRKLTGYGLLSTLLLVGGCGRAPKEPRLVFYAGVEIWGARAAVSTPDTTSVLTARSWKADSLSFGAPSGLWLTSRLLRSKSHPHAWALKSVLRNTGSGVENGVRAVAPIYAVEREGGFLEFSTGEAIHLACVSGGRVEPFGLLQPDQSISISCDTLFLVQPISRAVLVLSVVSDSTWRTTWIVRRQKRRKRRYDLIVWEKPSRSLQLRPGDEVRLPPVNVAVLTGRGASDLVDTFVGFEQGRPPGER